VCAARPVAASRPRLCIRRRIPDGIASRRAYGGRRSAASSSAGLLALRTVAEAYGGLAAIAAEAELSRESLYRALSPKGNPTLKTLLAVLKAVGMRLSVEPARKAA
jgi:probable addiction module antidote protein